MLTDRPSWSKAGRGSAPDKFILALLLPVSPVPGVMLMLLPVPLKPSPGVLPLLLRWLPPSGRDTLSSLAVPLALPLLLELLLAP
jgi:hypothetical protein